MTLQKLDTLNIISLSPALGMNNQGRYDVRDDKRQKLFGVKNVQGFPIDVRSFDEQFVYDSFTEGDPPELGNGHDGWTDPGDVKWHVGNRMRGNKMLPRYITYPFTTPYTVTDDDSPFGMIKNAQWDGAAHSVLATKYVLNPPTVKNWGGSVGAIPTWLLQYFYNGKPSGPLNAMIYGALETYEYGFDPADPVSRAFGLIHWTLNNRAASGAYQFARQNTPSVSLRKFLINQGPRLVKAPFLGIDGEI